MDTRQQIEREYRKLLGGTEMFEKWYKEATIDSRFTGVLRDRHRTKLTELGCHEPSDHVFIAVAIESPDKILLTEDSDMGKGIKGQDVIPRRILTYLTHWSEI
jgi:predicted nucleic acid-binding protein